MWFFCARPRGLKNIVKGWRAGRMKLPQLKAAVSDKILDIEITMQTVVELERPVDDGMEPKEA